jgi:hypothetical protein
MNVTALQVVAVLGAMLGSGIVLYLVVQIDHLTSASSATVLPTARTRRSRPILQRKAA